MTHIIGPALAQLWTQSPVLLVYLAGTVLALVFWRTRPTACLFVLVGTVVLFMLAVTQTFVSQYLLQSRAELGFSQEKLGKVFAGVALTSNLLRAGAVGLLLSAVFIQKAVSERAAGSTATPQPGGSAPGAGT